MTEVKWYDFTMSVEKSTIKDVTELGLSMEETGKLERFVVGFEIGDSGYEHFQGRVVFKKPTAFNTARLFFAQWNVTTHISETHTHDFNYVEKEGNFFRSWEGALRKYSAIAPLYWQQAVIAQLKNQNDREVMVVIDEKGNTGKSTFAKMMEARHEMKYVPPFDNAQDYMAMCMARPSKGYIIDIPRSESVHQRNGLWSAVEQIKNGYLYDKRNKFHDMWIEPPKILVFANEEPPYEALSQDRWQVFEIRHGTVGDNKGYLWPL